ncbi:MAG: response regulator [Opitutaceae bacterium]|nr:response regulator [Opitutaceae bacterium]
MGDPATLLNLLLVEDNESDAGLVLREFRRAGLIVEHQRVQSAATMRAALAARTWDAIICDFALPGFGAGAALEELRRTGQDLPFILVSGTIPDQAAVELMRHGAHDYILKDNLARLVPATQREIKEAEERRNRRRAELELEQSRAMYHSLVDTLPAAVFRKDLEGRFVFVNAQFCAFRGCAPEDILGRSVFDPADPELSRRFQDDDRRVIETGEVFHFEDTVCRPGSPPRTIEIVEGPVREASGAITGVQGFFWDITERRKAEEAHKSVEAQLRQVQKMEAIGQLSGGVAHDFNNILTVIQCHASLMGSDPKLPDELHEAVSEISHAAQRAANLTRQLLAFSRRQTLRPTDLDLNEVVANLTKMLQRIVGEDISVHLHFSPVPAQVHADASMLDQVVLNLVVNARDAMPEGGKLEIETHVCELDEAAARAMPEGRAGDFVCLSVSDTGTGMAPEVRARLFEPFFTTKDVGKGTGLGLATVYGIVRQHQGWIEVRSEIGRGSLFRIYLPYAAGTPTPHERTHTESSPVPGGDETILVVEDEPPLRLLVRAMLVKLGYKVLEAPSGVAAVKVWQEHRDHIHLLLTDMVMPDRMSGRDLALRVHEDRPDLPVIFITGYNPEMAGRDFVLEEGVNYVPKPFTPRKLGTTIRAVLDAHRHARPVAR